MNPQLAEQTKVLIVDDQVLAQGYMKYSLEELGFRDISYVDKAQVALDKIRVSHFDLIVCSYNLKKDQDGYYLYDELKSSHELPLTTAFIFISADTSAEVVHSIIELQPDDFLAKPFTVKDLDKRLTKVLQRKQALKRTYELMGRKQFDKALEEVELLLTNPDKSEFYPIALRVKGQLLGICGKWQDAHDFYLAILNVQRFTWAEIGLIESCIKLGFEEDAERRILRLAFRPDGQVIAYDLLTTLQINQKDFDGALETVLMGSEVSPRNIRRHQQAIDLSRVTHDYSAQYEAARKIVKFARNSMLDKPENYLNAARAGIDLALTVEDSETELLLRQTNDIIKQCQTHFPKSKLDEQLKVINARVLQLQDDKDSAKALIEEIQATDLSDQSMEDLLDKAKAFHELGFFDKAQSVLSEIEQRCRTEPGQGALFLHYVRQQKAEKQAIRQTPKQLNNDAATLYQQGELANALSVFRKAFSIMPKSPAIALNLLQTIAMRSRDQGLGDNTAKLAQRCIKTIENGALNEEQEERYLRVKSYLEESV